MWYVYRMLGASLALLSLACSEGAIDSSASSYAINAPTYAGAKEKTYVITTYNDSVTVSGECHSLTDSIKMSLDNGVTWQEPPSGGDLSCLGDGVFSFTINDCSMSGEFDSFGFAPAAPQGSRIKISLRSEIEIQGKLLTSNVSNLYVQLGTAFKTNYAGVSSGGGRMSGSNFKIVGSFGAPASRSTMSGSSFKVHLEE